MVESGDSSMERTFLSRWGLPLAVGTLLAGGSYWFLSARTRDAQATPQVVTAQGTAFDAPRTKESQPQAPEAESAKAGNRADTAIPPTSDGTPAAGLSPAPKSGPVPVAILEPVPIAASLESKAPEKAVQEKGNPLADAKASEPRVEPKPVEVKEESKIKEKAPESKAEPADAKALLVPFAKLAFRYWPQVKGGRDPIPAEVRKLDGRKVVIEGYMMPIDFDKGKIQSFLLTRNMMGCCYADSFQITDVIKVQRADGKPVSYMPLARVTGTLEVGEEKDADGYIESVYRIKADDLAPAMFGK